MCNIKTFERELKLSKSPQTVKSYTKQFSLFAQYFESEDLRYLSVDKIKDYVLLLHEMYGYSSIVHAIAAIEFYYNYLNKRKRKLSLPRPIKPKTLPTVLSIGEVKAMINLTLNLKHRAIIMTMFYHGLRRSELINLKISDIDSENMVLKVIQGKGSKDRNIPLSYECLEVLRLYYKAYRPNEYLFNGKFELKYSATSLANLIKQASKRAKINKNVHPHSLRHSFASYLVSLNINLIKIQSWMGHSSSKYTERYCHINNENNPIKLAS